MKFFDEPLHGLLVYQGRRYREPMPPVVFDHIKVVLAGTVRTPIVFYHETERAAGENGKHPGQSPMEGHIVYFGQPFATLSKQQVNERKPGHVSHIPLVPCLRGDAEPEQFVNCPRRPPMSRTAKVGRKRMTPKAQNPEDQRADKPSSEVDKRHVIPFLFEKAPLARAVSNIGNAPLHTLEAKFSPSRDEAEFG